MEQTTQLNYSARWTNGDLFGVEEARFDEMVDQWMVIEDEIVTNYKDYTFVEEEGDDAGNTGLHCGKASEKFFSILKTPGEYNMGMFLLHAFVHRVRMKINEAYFDREIKIITVTD